MEGGHRIPGWKDSPGHWILEYSDRGRSPTRGDPPTTARPTNTCGAAQVSDYECAHLDTVFHHECKRLVDEAP